MTIENQPREELSTPRKTTLWPPVEESFLETEDGERLYTRSARPPGRTRAWVVLVHGLGEHSGRYGHVAGALVARGFAVFGWDLPGHGRSSGVRGDIASGEALVRALSQICRLVREPRAPLFLFAHSLGGQLALQLLEREPLACRGAVIASPWLRLAFDPPWWKLLLARLAMRLWPAFSQDRGMRAERLSRDAAHLASFPDPDLVHQRLSARMFFSVIANGERIFAAAAALRTPLLLLHGDRDAVTSHFATGDFFTRIASTDKTLRFYPGARHETHNELDREEVLREVAQWMEARLSE